MTESIDIIKDMLKARVIDLCRQCLPRGRREGSEWVAHNPYVDEARKSPALKVALTGNKGAWRDWRNGDKGDILSLITFTQGYAKGDFRSTLKWARDFLGLAEMTPAERAALKRTIEQRKAADEKAERERRARKLARAHALWLEDTFELGLGTGPEAHARAYFRARGCALEDVAHAPAATFRFSADTEWWKGARFQRSHGGNRKVEAGPGFPAVHSAMRAASGAITCCHVTFLDPARPAKAPVDPPKLMLGEALGSVIEVALGPAAKSFWLADVAPAPLIIAEGIETALSIAKAVPEARVWAAGSLAGIGSCPVRFPHITDITVARDTNAGNAQAEHQLNAALARLEAANKPMAVIKSHVGDDFNDLEQGVE